MAGRVPGVEDSRVEPRAMGHYKEIRIYLNPPAIGFSRWWLT